MCIVTPNRLTDLNKTNIEDVVILEDRHELVFATITDIHANRSEAKASEK